MLLANDRHDGFVEVIRSKEILLASTIGQTMRLEIGATTFFNFLPRRVSQSYALLEHGWRESVAPGAQHVSQRFHKTPGLRPYVRDWTAGAGGSG